MHDQKFFDQTLAMIEANAIEAAMPMLAGKLHSDSLSPRWDGLLSTYQAHPLRQVLLEDPYVARCVAKPRGYAGDAELIEMIYEQTPPPGTSALGQRIFNTVIRFGSCEAVRLRRDYSAGFVSAAHGAGQRILSLACGYFREGDALVGTDISGIVLVDQDPLSLAVVRQRHGSAARCHEANVFSYLRSAAARGERFDLVYTLGLTDYLDARAMRLLHKLVVAVLAPGGRFVLANFVPGHLAVGWMEAVMEWQLIYREAAELEGYAAEAGLKARTWLDPTGSIAWCEMTAG